ncbi:MAG: hypothetical protein U1E29_13530 [Coriobacteriia bacterium]|nr:hypothetical protein [Coriobacteriia bacterium]
MDDHCVVLGLDVADYITCAYHDLTLRDDVAIAWGVKGRLARTLKKLSTSFKVNAVLRVPLQSIWARYEISQCRPGRGDRHIFVCFESPEGLNPAYLQYVRRAYPRSALCLILLNPLDENVSERLNRVESLYDVIITCNEADATRRGWLYHPDCYSRVPSEIGAVAQSDVCFIGTAKDRVATAHAVYTRIRETGLACDFWIVGKEQEYPESDGFRYLSRMLPYSEYLARIGATKCILEIVARDAHYCTLRTMEAVTYEKKLLTTNRMIVEEPFFQAENIQVFRNAEDIDVGFIQLPYSPLAAGDLFSPAHLLEFISSAVAERVAGTVAQSETTADGRCTMVGECPSNVAANKS